MDIQHGIMSADFSACIAKATTRPATARSGAATTSPTNLEALLYAINLRNLYYGVAKGDDIRVLMLSRVLLGRWRWLEGAGKAELKAQRYAHNVELTGSAQQHKRDTSKGYEKSVEDYRDAKLARAPMQKGFKTAYRDSRAATSTPTSATSRCRWRTRAATNFWWRWASRDLSGVHGLREERLKSAARMIQRS